MDLKEKLRDMNNKYKIFKDRSLSKENNNHNNLSQSQLIKKEKFKKSVNLPIKSNKI